MRDEKTVFMAVASMVGWGCAQGVPVGHDPDGRLDPLGHDAEDVPFDLGDGHDVGDDGECDLGPGAPCFLPGVIVSTTHVPVTMHLNDVTGDAVVDVILGNGATHSVQVLSRPRWGGFASEVVLPVDGNIVALTAANLDADGVADVVVLTNDPDVAWTFRGGEDALAKGYELPGRPVAVAAGDLDDDGFDELFVGLADATLGVLDIDAGATWDELLTDEAAAVSIRVAGDPTSAVAFVDADGRASVWKLGAPEITQLASADVAEVHVADVTGDAELDVIVGSAVGDPWMLEGRGHGFAAQRVLGGVGPTLAVTAADIDGDETADIIAIGSDARARIFDGPSLAPVASVALSGPTDMVAAGDMDDDGYVDIVAVHDAMRALELVLRER